MATPKNVHLVLRASSMQCFESSLKLQNKKGRVGMGQMLVMANISSGNYLHIYASNPEMWLDMLAVGLLLFVEHKSLKRFNDPISISRKSCI